MLALYQFAILLHILYVNRMFFLDYNILCCKSMCKVSCMEYVYICACIHFRYSSTHTYILCTCLCVHVKEVFLHVTFIQQYIHKIFGKWSEVVSPQDPSMQHLQHTSFVPQDPPSMHNVLVLSRSL